MFEKKYSDINSMVALLQNVSEEILTDGEREALEFSMKEFADRRIYSSSERICKNNLYPVVPLPTGMTLSPSFPPPDDSRWGILQKALIEYGWSKISGGDLRELHLIQSVSALDDLIKTENLLKERLFEWYGRYYPSAARFINNIRVLKAIATDPSKENLNRVLADEMKEGHLGEEFVPFYSKSISSFTKTRQNEDKRGSTDGENQYSDFHFGEYGAFQVISTLSKQILEIEKNKNRIMEFIEETVGSIAPATSAVCSPQIAARLIHIAGSLRKLASLPVSTVQLLGAEKAMFAHLKYKTKCPKHGIHQSPWWIRGKIARAMAGKISLAARYDFFSTDEEEDDRAEYGIALRDTLIQKTENLKKLYPLAPEKIRKKSVIQTRERNINKNKNPRYKRNKRYRFQVNKASSGNTDNSGKKIYKGNKKILPGRK
ncbi:MAG: hypothetical protein QW728_07985 [Thermoplasmata archaeon]